MPCAACSVPAAEKVTSAKRSRRGGMLMIGFGMPSRTGLLMALTIIASSAALAAPARRAAPAPSGAALALFKQDWVLMNWALRFYDGNNDSALSAAEAAPAARRFRKMADKDRDGRVTPAEYHAARQFIIARY